MTEPVLYDVPKRCECGATWTGKAFSPATEVRMGTCDACVAKWGAHIAELQRPVVVESPADVELQPPRLVGEIE